MDPEVILFELNAAFGAVRNLLARRAAFGPKVKGVVQMRDKVSRADPQSVLV